MSPDRDVPGPVTQEAVHVRGSSRHLPEDFAQELRVVVAALQTKRPHLEGVIGRANAVLTDGRLFVLPGGAEALVRSPDGTAIYHVGTTCDCPHATNHPDELCKHYYSLALYTMVQKRLARHAVAPEPRDQEGEAADEERLQIPTHFLQTIAGKPFIKYAGLLQLAQEKGLVSLQATWTFNDEGLSLARAVAVFADGRRFEECGDSTPESGQRVGLHWRRLSLTRAKARSLRDALGLDLCAVEEME